MARRVKPTIQVEKRGGQLLPITEYDALAMESHSEGQLYDIAPVAERSNPHHKLYWATLGNVVKATNGWATSAHLHDDLKILCGHYRSVVNQANGGVYYVADSIAYAKMNQDQFKEYFDQAMAKLAETIGYDPLSPNV
jgi:hypothetical protein